MTEAEISELFIDTIKHTRALYNKIEGYSEDTIHNWKTGRTQPKLGDMLSVIYQMKLISLQKNG